jgi:parvulin-like peptidyl-prolyl isomerase
MAKRTTKRTAPTKKHLARVERERRQMRYILIGSLLVLALVVALVLYGILDQLVLQKTRSVADVNGEGIRADAFENFTRYNRYLMVRNALQTYQFAEMFAGDPETQAQFQSQILQIQAQMDPVSGSVGEDSLNQMVDAALVRQEAEKAGITITDQELDTAMQEAFGYFAQGTPTPTATSPVLPTSTLSPQQLTLIPPTATATITPTLTATATLTESLTAEPPTETPEPSATATLAPTDANTPTPAPTATASATPTPYTEEGFQALYADTIQNFADEYGISEETIQYVIENQVYRNKMQEKIVGDLPCTQEQVWALHILVATEEEAQDILNRLDQGEEWGALASTYSTDTSNKDRGGDLGWFGTGMMVPEFEEAAFALEVGETSDPVQTSFGWHIIRLLGKEERPLTEEACQQTRQEKFQEWLDGVREGATIEIKDYWSEHVPSEPALPAEVLLFAQSSVAAPQQPTEVPEP